MKKTLFTSALVIASLFLTAASSPSADSSATRSVVLKSVSCAPECGFMCRSHDEQELIQIVKTHAKSAHGKTLTDDQVREMMQ